MRASVAGAIVLVSLLAVACSPSAPPATQQAADSKPAEPPKPEPVPSDVPIPVGLQGRVDSAMPGTKFFVVQGQIPVSVIEAETAFRKQADDNGWKTAGEPTLAPDGSVATLVFGKDTRSLKVTLVKTQNAVTSMNLLTGPK
mgnify:FL=1